MKILFFIALLINIVFFLWEVNVRSSHPTSLIKKNGLLINKQILLVDELEVKKKSESQIVQNTENRVVKPIVEEVSSNSLPKSLVKRTENKSSFVQGSIFEVAQDINDLGITSENTNMLEKFFDGNNNENVENRLPMLTNKEETEKTMENNLVDDQPEPTPKIIKEKQKQKYCFEIGPFINHSDIRLWRKSNEISPELLTLVDKKIKILSSYLVYYPARESFQESKEIAKAYEEKNITDVWLFRKGDLRGVISFGLFKKENRAMRLQKKLVKTGLEVEIMQRFKTELRPYAQILTEDDSFANKIRVIDTQAIKECVDVLE